MHESLSWLTFEASKLGAKQIFHKANMGAQCISICTLGKTENLLQAKSKRLDVCNEFYGYTYYNGVRLEYGVNPYWEGTQNDRIVYSFSDVETKCMHQDQVVRDFQDDDIQAGKYLQVRVDGFIPRCCWKGDKDIAFEFMECSYSHGICPACVKSKDETVYQPLFGKTHAELRKKTLQKIADLKRADPAGLYLFM